MKACKLYQAIFRFAPFYDLKDWALRRHLESCASCSRQLATREELGPLLAAEDFNHTERLWLRVQAALFPAAAAQVKAWVHDYPRRLRLVAASMLSLLAILGFIYFFLFHPGAWREPKANQTGLQIIHFFVEDKPAAPVIYKPFGSRLIFIWAPSPEKNSAP